MLAAARSVWRMLLGFRSLLPAGLFNLEVFVILFRRVRHLSLLRPDLGRLFVACRVRFCPLVFRGVSQT